MLLEFWIEKKFCKGYPQDNIVFDDSHEAVLIQNKHQVMRCGVEDPAQLQKLLELFFGYERPEIADFRKRRRSQSPTAQFLITCTVFCTIQRIVKNTS
jgi:hypothetical protein